MKTKIIQATTGPMGNWGKFLVGSFDCEWSARPEIEGTDNHMPLLRYLGWDQHHTLVLDLETGEGAVFRAGGLAVADLNRKHRIWVCPLFEPFLTWLYKQDLSDVEKLPALVEFTAEQAPFAFRGRRRQGGPPGKVIVDVDRQTEDLLGVLGRGFALGHQGTASEVVEFLVHSAADGVRRPGSWERAWLQMAFSDDWATHLERDPDCPVNQRPRPTDAGQSPVDAPGEREVAHGEGGPGDPEKGSP